MQTDCFDDNSKLLSIFDNENEFFALYEMIKRDFEETKRVVEQTQNFAPQIFNQKRLRKFKTIINYIGNKQL
ncbi:hypothetical protein QE197_21685 (plasmid) [Arsenophonus nasoniae]|uniref:Uncharacterized protein n=1 Tax=Arsenophonus nasoniae TaxID=638 RepID=A0A4P7L0Z7_9GAMM|nr:hypothetical protein [Arsenophonus nasoniae]QBY46126.1 hypothetical protein ArsFIN_47370 [Arsenophonus nasoniae]WGM08191.1 hypothetical protein QE258_23290 [Arsenophonus nasoniae]WGM13041.1 hypothetical protein QE197_21685 [Arsenophonus nasoniae]WGM17772.1 hypothetical protein QE193_20960 [Arsenophonus nasoniae]